MENCCPSLLTLYLIILFYFLFCWEYLGCDLKMKYLERKQKFAKLGSNGSSGAKLKGQCLPTDLDLKETYFKGSLLDRVAALEHRLFQVNFCCLI